MDEILHYAFMDESGTVGATGTRFLVVAALTTTRPRYLELIVRHALKKYRRSLKYGEIKAARVRG